MGRAMTILPLTYLGNIEYFAALCSGGNAVIDLGENYVKQTYRNRCEIMTAGGVATLTVNVSKGGSIHKKAVRDMRIDHSKRWLHQHWVSLVSAYGNSPYFDHYRDRFEPFYAAEPGSLAVFNRGLLETMLDCLGMRPDFRYSDEYVKAGPGDTDLRPHFSPERRDPPTGRAIKNPGAEPEPYYQVFSDKHPFAPNLSAIDLLFCEGPGAARIIGEFPLSFQ